MDRKLLGLGALFLVTFISFISFVLFKEPIGRFTRASAEKNVVSADTSLIFAWPLAVAADGLGKSDITIFVRNADGKGVPDKNVTIQTTHGKVVPENAVSNAEGKVTATISADSPGVAKIEVIGDNIPFVRSISVKFE